MMLTPCSSLRRRWVRRWLLCATAMLCACAATALGTAVSPAFASEGPSWHLNATAAPTNVPPEGEAQLVVTATNVGDVQVEGSPTHVIFTDELPEHMTPVAVEAEAGRGVPGHEIIGVSLTNCQFIHVPDGHSAVSCEFTEILPVADYLMMRITVNTEHPAQSGPQNVLTVQGGNAAPATLTRTLTVQTAETRFGVQTYELTPENEGGGRDTQAGSHPFQLTTTLDLNQTLAHYSTFGEKGIFPSAPALPRELRFKLPPGLVGDTTAVPQCSDVAFATVGPEDTVNLCPADAAVGFASVIVNDPDPAGFKQWDIPVFNLTPEAGEPARFGFMLEGVPIILRTSLPAGGEYGVEIIVSEISQAVQVLSSQVTLWGTPADPRHDSARGWACLGNATWYGTEQHEPCTPTGESSPTAFLTLPTSCASPPETSVSGESWSAGSALPASPLTGQTSSRFPAALQGCSALGFEPSLTTEPQEHTASTPTGLNVSLGMPQPGLLNPDGRAESALRQTTVALPEGLRLNPSAANGLAACEPSLAGFLESGPGDLQQKLQAQLFTPTLPAPAQLQPGVNICADSAKVGTVSIRTPLLQHELQGSVYLGSQDTNPFGSPLVLYLIAQDPVSGVTVKLAGEVNIDQNGQLTTTFANTPQLPFEKLALQFFGGARGSLSTPARCGDYTSQASFTPWSETATVTGNPGFAITQGPGGGPCPSAPAPFAPALNAGSTSGQAGAFTDFQLEIAHRDGDQPLQGVNVHLPAGVAALLAKVTPCPEPAPGQEWSCGPQSLIGHSSASSGLGGEPVTLPGSVYLTQGYDGAPFGLLVQTPAQAGPFNLGMVNVRSQITVNPNTAAVTVLTDPGARGEAIPTMLKGVPVQLKRLQVTIDRPEFQFNPTDCNPLPIQGTLSGAEGASAQVSTPFQVGGCASLPFKPKLTANTRGQASKANGANLDVKIESKGLGQANIAKVRLQLPKALPARLSTLQKACTEGAFNANPASCPEGSVIGHATVRTPVLKSPVTGPAYLVSHGNAAFPDVEFVLQGEGITLVLDGKTQIKKQITYSKFESAPDAPFTVFETTLPAGPHSVLTANLPEKDKFNLCATSLSMPTEIVAQNGALIRQNTKITKQGCRAVKASKSKHLTRKQKLARALKACRRQDKRSRARLNRCEHTARRRFTTTRRSHKA
jgi:hypothetical protein